MDKLIVLGTGNAMVTKCYNTCFALECNSEYLLTDAGGGNGILKQVESANIEFDKIHNLIVTHEHCDHLLGVAWVIRKIGTMILANKYEGNLQVWCHEELAEKVKILASLTLAKKIINLLGERIIINVVCDGDKKQMMGHEVTFFDIHSTKAPQYGFCVETKHGKITCLGDEPYNPKCEKYIKSTRWLLCEAFCLYSERDKFKPYEKHHSTVKDACELASELKIPNLVLWHTEDKNYENREMLYKTEGEKYYKGNLYVPYDLDEIDLTDGSDKK